jgi:hypothetical protein
LSFRLFISQFSNNFPIFIHILVALVPFTVVKKLAQILDPRV